MAYANWLYVDPPAGNGDDSVEVSSTAEHTGREVRTTNLTFKAANCADIVRTVKQAGKPEYTEWDNTTAAVAKSGGTVTLTGVSNSSALTFALGTDNIGLTLPENYTANSETTANGAAISGDPGADAEYAFSVQLSVPANATIDDLTAQVTVTDAAGNMQMITITLAAGDPYLELPEYESEDDVINLDYTGAVVSIAVKSNTEWTVE
ncbi:MAG: hypothetical protein LUC22_03940 [Prevotella sp.]|nr:hypothetical protein [Prevotella sp.]